MNQSNHVAYGAVVGCVLLLTAFLLLLPAYFLATGIQAIGAAAGWWIGDSSVNDGEETWATAAGAVSTLVLLAVALATLLALRTPFGVTSRLPAIVGVALVAALYLALGLVLYTLPVPGIYPGTTVY